MSISNTDDPPNIADEVRAAFHGVVADVCGFKRRIARSELQLAKLWCTQGDLDLQLDEEGFSDLLEIEAFGVGENRLTVWLRETANIFSGHMLEVRIESEGITEICLVG